jgi:hypothetical protein
MFKKELKEKLQNTTLNNNNLSNRVKELEDLICPFNKHDFIVIDTSYGYSCSCGEVSTYNKRVLQCKKCKKIVHDNDAETGFKYKVSE